MRLSFNKKAATAIFLILMSQAGFFSQAYAARINGNAAAASSQLPDDDDFSEEEFTQDTHQQVVIDDAIFASEWTRVPFNTRRFTYTPAQIEEKWPHLMRAIRVPYPSMEYLQSRYEGIPALAEHMPNFDGDFKKLHDQVIQTWIYFFSGQYQKAREHGAELGPIGEIPAYLSQIIYAVYLSESTEEKHMLLQDAANQVARYSKILNSIKNDPEYQTDYMLFRLGYAYAIARIAEEVPVSTSLARNYLFKISRASKDVLAIDQTHPIALAFRAGVDANIIRKVGKAVGRVTYGARQSRVKKYFNQSFDAVEDMSVLYYEYGNSLLYLNRKREIEGAITAYEAAINFETSFAMEELDRLYAKKRLAEVQDFLQYGRSFRSYERNRMRFIKKTNQNLYNILQPPFLITEYAADKKGYINQHRVN